MVQQNFYLLLDLPVDPPEEDPVAIENAIKKKQAEWSRFRNHPTKGLQAKHFIDLIPEMRKVMLDPELRRKQANEARRQREKEDEKKFLKVDRHLRIFLSKGSITNKEAFKLVQLHGFEVEDVLKRAIKIENKLKERSETRPEVYTCKNSPEMAQRFAEIETHLGTRMYKGFITEKEVETFSKMYDLEKDAIKNHVYYPIQEAPPKKPVEPKTIDKSIEKSIHDNLKIVGKSSLYEFLELSADADLDTLQKKASEKRKAMLAATQKNAVVTASGELAGHCITLFKTRESRTTYDVTRARTKFKSIDTDIEAAQIDGGIRLEYFEAIIDNAAKQGIEPEVAGNYIAEYCKRNNWKYTSKEKRKRFIIVTTGITSFVVLMIIIVVFVVQIIKSRQMKAEYLDVNEKVAVEKVLEKKRDILANYLKSHDQTEFTEDARKNIKDIESKIKKRDNIDKKDYNTAVQNADKLNAEKDFEALQDNYQKYISAHPNGLYAKELRQKVSEFPILIEKRDFDKLNNIPQKKSQDRIEAYESYLNKHPQGKHQEEVRNLISSMRDDYFRYIKKEIAVHEQKKAWDKCIALCNEYLKHYQGDNNALELKGDRLFYQKQYDNLKVLNTLIAEAEKAGKDTKKAIKIYETYLKKNPTSPIKYEIKKRISVLKKKLGENQ